MSDPTLTEAVVRDLLVKANAATPGPWAWESWKDGWPLGVESDMAVVGPRQFLSHGLVATGPKREDDGAYYEVAHGITLDDGAYILGDIPDGRYIEAADPTTVAALARDWLALRAAIRTHRDQKADDRCIEDDDRLYAALGDGIKCDRRVGDKAAMLANCQRFIENRCEGGEWRSYAELEAENARLRAACCQPFASGPAAATQAEPSGAGCQFHDNRFLPHTESMGVRI